MAEPGRNRPDTFVLVGGAGFVGTAATRVLCERGAHVVVVDRRPPRRYADDAAVTWIECDLLADRIHLPFGRIVVMVGNGDPRPRWPWTLALDIAVTTARLLPVLRGRSITLVSSVEVYGDARPPLTEDTPFSLPWSMAELAAWCDEVRRAATEPCPPWRVAALCRRLADADPSGRWVYGLAKAAQELLVRTAVDEDHCTILRLANTFGVGQERVITRLIRGALANRPVAVTSAALRSFLPVEEVGRVLTMPLGPGTFNIGGPPIGVGDLADMVARVCGSAPWETVAAPASDSCGVLDTSRADASGVRLRPLQEALADVVDKIQNEHTPLFDPPLAVVIPPRPARPDELADRQQAILWSGKVKNGNRWSTEFRERLHVALALGDGDELLVTKSGTYALRLAIAGTIGAAKPGQLAVLPSFTYRATADVLVQLGYGLRYVDVDPWSWTLDPAAVALALSDERVALVVCVDTFGNPCAYQALRDLCAERGVPLIADSAASLGSSYQGRPVGGQAHAHAFSMSFAKALTAAGAGGAVVFTAEAPRRDPFAWRTSSLMDELHAVAALEQLALLPDLVRRRNLIAQAYDRAADRLDGFIRQGITAGNGHSYVHWVAQVPAREALVQRLAVLGIETKPYFQAQHLHHELPSAELPLPVTERLDQEALAFPMSSELSEQQADTVVAAIEEVWLWKRHGRERERVDARR